MRLAISAALLAVVAGCGKQPDPTKQAGGSGSAGSAKAAASDDDSDDAPGGGLTVTDTATPEFSGSYDKVFAKLANADEGVTLAFVRGCPALVCTDNVFEIESIAGKCPKAYLALATLPKGPDGRDPKAGHHRRELLLAGPAEKPATATVDKVTLEISDLGPDGVIGRARSKTTDASVKGAFKAEICGRM
jgi:hypothetical protein